MDSSRSITLPRSVATVSAQAARSKTTTRQLSVLLERSITTLIGVSQEQGREKPGGSAEAARDQMIEERNGGEPFQNLRQQHAQPVETEELCADDLDPDRDGRFVERDKTGGIERVEEEIVPAVHHAADTGAVVLRAVTVLVEPPEPEAHPKRHHPAQTCP